MRWTDTSSSGYRQLDWRENDVFTCKEIGLLLTSVVLSVASLAPAFAQNGGAGPVANDSDTANPVAASKPTTTTKAQRKAGRKQARAKKNAELKKPESNGYNPAARNDANYPQDLQNAEKKAAVGAAASQ